MSSNIVILYTYIILHFAQFGKGQSHFCLISLTFRRSIISLLPSMLPYNVICISIFTKCFSSNFPNASSCFEFYEFWRLEMFTLIKSTSMVAHKTRFAIHFNCICVLEFLVFVYRDKARFVVILSHITVKHRRLSWN